MSSVAEAKAAIYSRLASAPTFHPASADLFTDWRLQGGDVLTVKSDNESYTLPVFGMKIRWTGSTKVAVQSSGKEYRESVENMSQKISTARSGQYRRNLYSVENNNEIHHDIYSEDGLLHTSITATASHFNTVVEAAVSGMQSSILQAVSGIETSVSEANSLIYTYIEQTASGIRSDIVDMEEGLYNFTVETASGIRQTLISTTNRTWIQDNDPTTAAGGSHTPKTGDVWVESTHQGTWDGAEGFDWEYDESFDWRQIQGAKIWGWANDKWELVSDQQEIISYSDLINTTEHLVSQKIKGVINDEGLIEIYLAQLEQTAEQIRGEVSTANSTVYSFINQTATNVLIQVGLSPRTVVSVDAPTTIDGRALQEGDVWVLSHDQGNWDAAYDLSWSDDSEIDWNALRSDKIYVYHNGAWQEVMDGTALIDDADIEVEHGQVKLFARKLEQVDGELQRYYAELTVGARQIQSRVDEYYNQLGSSITQTARQIRLDVFAENSQIYSFIDQTATNIRIAVADEIEGVSATITTTATSIRQEVVNSISDVRASITTTATEIWSDVSAANSSVYSHISQTATQIRQEITSTKSGLMTSITTTANGIRNDVSAANSTIYSYINQTSTFIQLRVAEAPRSVVSKTQPTQINNRDLQEGDIWIDSEEQETWDKALTYSWSDDQDINWNKLRSDDVKIYHNGEWKPVIDGTMLVDDADIEVEKNTVKTYARQLEAVEGQLNTYYAELTVGAREIQSQVTRNRDELGSRITQTAESIRSEVWDKTEGLSSRITQTASQIRAEVTAADSFLISYIDQTATFITQAVYDESSDLRAVITTTAQGIRTDVSAANSELYSYIDETATSINMAVVDATSSMMSSIEVTAQGIWTDVSAANSAVYTCIEQTATQIRSDVEDTISGVRSTITQQANKISLVVEGEGANAKVNRASIVTSINTGGEGSVFISADQINLEGYVTATQLTSNFIQGKIADLSVLTVNSMGAENGIYSTTGYLMAPYIYLGVAGNAQSMATSIHDLQIVLNSSTNVYTLQKKDFESSSWQNVGNFSRATSLSGEWRGDTYGTYVVTASPQGDAITLNPLVHALTGTNTSAIFKVGILEGSTWTDHGAAVYAYLRQTGNVMYLRATNTDSGDILAQRTITDANLSAGNIRKGVSILGTTGSYDVVLTEPQSGSTVPLTESNTFTVRTSGRKDASGVADEQTKVVELHLYSYGWSSGTNTVDMKWGATTGSSGTTYARTVVNMPSGSSMNIGTPSSSSLPDTYTYDKDVSINGTDKYYWIPITLGGKTYKIRVHVLNA